MSIESEERKIIIKNKTMREVKSFLKENTYREEDTVMLAGPYNEGDSISVLLKEMYTLSNGRRAVKSDTQTGRITVESHADGVHVNFQRSKFYDSELFWQTKDALVHEMKQRDFLVWDWLSPNPPNPQVHGWDSVFDWYYEWQKQHSQKMTVVDLADKIHYSYGHVRDRKSEYDAEHGTGE